MNYEIYYEIIRVCDHIIEHKFDYNKVNSPFTNLCTAFKTIKSILVDSGNIQPAVKEGLLLLHQLISEIKSIAIALHSIDMIYQKSKPRRIRDTLIYYYDRTADDLVRNAKVLKEFIRSILTDQLSGIKEVLDRAELFLAALRAATPHVKIGLCLTPVPNSREKAFLNSYDGEFHQWTWRQVQHLLVQSQIEQFSNRENEHIYIIPTTLYVDSDAGYPDHNAVHPNAIGYAQIAAAIYSWLKNIT